MTWLLVDRAFGGPWGLRARHAAATGRRRRCWYFLYTHLLESFGSYIAVEADIEEPISFPCRPVGVFIAPEAVIGSGCTMLQHSGIVAVRTEGSKLSGGPTIGRNVYLGAGARVVGAVHIGDGARLEAGVTVAQDIPAGAVVTTPVPRIIGTV